MLALTDSNAYDLRKRRRIKWWWNFVDGTDEEICKAGDDWMTFDRHDCVRGVWGCSGVTSWRRLRDWTEAGGRPRLHAALLTELRRAELLDPDDCAMDGSHVRALKDRIRGIMSDPQPSTVFAPAPSTT